MQLTIPQLVAATGCGNLRAYTFIEPLTATMRFYGIDTKQRAAHFLAQIAVESASLGRLEENLSYTAERMCQVWQSRFKTVSEAAPFARNPEGSANKLYGGRMGKTQPGDGWQYRGRA
jgi:putative chitinase